MIISKITAVKLQRTISCILLQQGQYTRLLSHLMLNRLEIHFTVHLQFFTSFFFFSSIVLSVFFLMNGINFINCACLNFVYKDEPESESTLLFELANRPNEFGKMKIVYIFKCSMLNRMNILVNTLFKFSKEPFLPNLR